MLWLTIITLSFYRWARLAVCATRSLPPAHAHGSAIAITASEYQPGPASHRAIAPAVLIRVPTTPTLKVGADLEFSTWARRNTAGLLAGRGAGEPFPRRSGAKRLSYARRAQQAFAQSAR
jgi:hypothetical protein